MNKQMELDGRLMRMEDSEAVDLSIVIPLYDEKENVRILYQQIKESLENLHRTYEIIFVDDGSDDGTGEELTALAEIDSHVVVISFRRNFGQTAAIQAGFDYSSGDHVICLDGDLQNDPVDFPRLLAKMEEGYDVVSGWRKHRKDNTSTRKIPSRFANWLINYLISGTGTALNDYGCTLKVYKRWVIDELRLYGEMHRFIPAYAALMGARIGEIEVNHRERRYGRSKYGLDRANRVILDLVTLRFFATSMTRPLHFFAKISAGFVVLGLMGSLICHGFSYVVDMGIDLNTHLLINGFCLFLASQFVVLGLLGEIIIRLYFEINGRRPYTIREIQARGKQVLPSGSREDRVQMYQ